MVPQSLLRFLVACLITSTLLLTGAHARAQDDDIQLIPTPAPAAAPSAPAAPPPPAPGEIEIRGMHCTPDLKEVEIRRAIPIACTVDYPAAGVELRYRMEGDSKKWDKIELASSDNGYTATIPCTVTNKRGTMQFYLFARNENNKVIARVGRRETPLSVRLVEHSNVAPPALPGQKAPERCFAANECPADSLGTPACPGTHAPPPKVVKKSWGATCKDTDECQSGLECIKNSCETPAKCEDSKDCGEGGECVDGACHMPTTEELKERIGPPKHHWVGLHAGADLYMMSAASGVCGNTTDDSQHYACFDGGNQYAGTPNSTPDYSGKVKGSMTFATVRVMLSYDYAFGRLLLGGRLGWAFRGAPKDFSPIHIEARAHYSLVSKPFDKHFRPYLGLAFGHAQVDASSKVVILDCVSHDDNCINSTDPNELRNLLGDPNVAVQRQLNAYHSGAPFFFGPSLMLMYAFTNDSALVFNLTAMLPDVTFQPSLGYEMGL